MNRKTINKEIIIKGKSWYTASDTWVKCSPGSDGIYLMFKNKRISINDVVINRAETNYTTSIFIGSEKIFMTEHLFSAINGLEIDDLEVEFGDNDVPFSADSSLFTNALSEVVITVNNCSRDSIVINKHISIVDGNKSCDICPSNTLEIIVNVEFDSPIGKQSYSYLQNSSDYIKEISRARSVLLFPIEEGDDWKNYKKQFPIFPKIFPIDPKECPFIAYSQTKFLNGLRFDNEVARHKILDFLGDILFLGKPVKGRFVLNRPGHSFNAKVVDAILTHNSSSR